MIVNRNKATRGNKKIITPSKEKKRIFMKCGEGEL